jgi:hypothetical protein
LGDYTLRQKILYDPTFEELDGIIFILEWDFDYSLATIKGMNKDISDHIPLLLSSGYPPYHCII